MKLTLDKEYQMLANEGFIRRAAQLDMPFMLKGSYVTRQYMKDPEDRFANDLDWVYLGEVDDVEDATRTFNTWAKAVTEIDLDDGIRFRSFSEDAFWRMIDYAMADDFPTINTDLLCYVQGQEFKIYSMDLSFNLDVDPGPVPLFYQPMKGEPFTIPYTCPLALQIAWKLHQTIVNTRAKDIFDLICLLSSPLFDAKTREQAVQALVNECYADRVNYRLLDWFTSEKAERYFFLLESGSKNAPEFKSLHAMIAPYPFLVAFDMSNARFALTDKSILPAAMSTFLVQFRNALNKAGFTSEYLVQFPPPNRFQRKNYRK